MLLLRAFAAACDRTCTVAGPPLLTTGPNDSLLVLCEARRYRTHRFGPGTAKAGPSSCQKALTSPIDFPCIPPSIARTSSLPTKVATPAERATEARLSPSHPPYPRALLSQSLVLTAHAAARLSYVLRGGSVPQVGLYGKVLLVTVLVPRYAHHFLHPARHHMTMSSLISTPPLLPCLLPSFLPTYNPPVIMVSSIILDPHPVIKQAGMMEHATSNAAGLRPISGICIEV